MMQNRNTKRMRILMGYKMKKKIMMMKMRMMAWIMELKK